MQQRAVKTRQQILESAVRVFAEKGFSGATVDEIAEAAAVNKQRIYAYFGSKQGLFEAALLACFSEVELFSRKMLKEIADSPQRMTELQLGGFFAAHRRNPRFWRLLSWANLEGVSDLSPLDRARSGDNAEIRRLFDAAVAAGQIRPVDFHTYLFTLLAVSYFYFSNRKTLIHTLGGELFSDGDGGRLCEQLGNVFQP